MKKVISMVVCATVVLLAAGVVMAGECKGKGEKACKKGDFFAKADADKDGKISLAEFKAACPGKGDAEAKFTAKDADKDGFLTKEEMKAGHPKHGKKGEKCTAPAAPAPVAPAAPAPVAPAAPAAQ